MRDLKDAGGVVCFGFTLLHGAAGAEFAAGEVEDGGAVSELRVLEERAAAGLLDVVAMRGDGEDVDGGCQRARTPCSIVTFSRAMVRFSPTISLRRGSTRVILSSSSTAMRRRGSLPPASTSDDVLMREPPTNPADAWSTTAFSTCSSSRHLSICRCKGRPLKESPSVK